MSRKARAKNQKIQGALEQVLSQDYWEGVYSLRDGNIVLCGDEEGKTARYRVFNIYNGGELCSGSLDYGESTKLSDLSGLISNEYGSGILLRLSNESENPDRHEEILSILQSCEKFELLRIQNLIRYIRGKGINVFGGRIGGQSLSDGGYGGFYLLEDGMVLLCKDIFDWDPKELDRIVDGVAAYRILDPKAFGLKGSREQYFGYISGDRFSDLAEEMRPKHGRIVSRLSEQDDEMHGLLMKALQGDAPSAAMASHRLRLNLTIG